MILSAAKLRAHLYEIIAQVSTSGMPIEIEYKGMLVKLVPSKTKGKLDKLKKRPGTIVGDPEDIVHLDWSNEWESNI